MFSFQFSSCSLIDFRRSRKKKKLINSYSRYMYVANKINAVYTYILQTTDEQILFIYFGWMINGVRNTANYHFRVNTDKLAFRNIFFCPLKNISNRQDTTKYNMIQIYE